ncbi:glycosyl hydrolase family 8 [Succinivibrio sp.]|uniref:glycosyl hydrolase family 8 n=1 Tax=Succinivibrio sp. TaxID=2053619 RepID=UPI00386839F1
MKIKELLKKSITAAFVLLSLTSTAFASAWDDYKQRYLSADGSIIDTGNNRISHTEGQSYGLLFSLYYDDQESFSKILNWTDNNLFNQEKGLYIWAYKRNENDPLTDKNNATDGDLMIAWVLIEAGKKWNKPEYRKKGEKLLSVIQNTLIIDFAKRPVLLPGLVSFLENSRITINPSYYIYPALKAVNKHTYQKKWKQLADEGKKLITAVEDRKVPITPDWITLDLNGKVQVSDRWPARSSYDAIRVPLYLYWEDENALELAEWKKWFSSFPADRTPAYVDVLSGEKANYNMSSGLLNVRKLVLGESVSEPVFTEKEDYYNASLSMLAYLAYNHAFSQK